MRRNAETAEDHSDRDSIFEPGRNCWRVDTARHAAPLIDVRDYYFAIADAISKAKHSIFILGWDIDSRIHLLRGEDVHKLHVPPVAGDLLGWKAEHNPQLQIYLLRWDYAVAFLKDREILAKLAWQAKTPSNVQICLDSTGPVGGSHHQKIILIDDEIAFTGGMDIALCRWDTGEHLPDDPRRHDPTGPYAPYHDMQVVIDGPMVKHFAELVRMRWKNAHGRDAVPIRKRKWRAHDQLPAVWPTEFPPVLENIRCGIARTMPLGYQYVPELEVEPMLLDLIERAKHFLYIENQFFTRQRVAHALNDKLRRCLELRALLVSSYNPQGIFEQEALWGSRIAFKEILYKDIDPERVLMVYPAVRRPEGGEDAVVRIHAKCMIVDDRYIDIGSSNINNRSMALDTECDLIFEATTAHHRKAITAIRDRLIYQHTEFTSEQIGHLVETGAPLEAFTEGKSQHYLRVIDDSVWTHGDFRDWANAVADPDAPLPLPVPRVMGGRKKMTGRFFMLCLVGALTVAAFFTALWKLTPLSAFASPDHVNGLMQSLDNSPGGIALILIIYVLAGLIVFPITVLVAATAATLGAVKGGIIAMAGSLLSALALFGIGKLAGRRLLKRMMGPRLRAINDRMKSNGMLGVALIRMVPVAPFSLVNLAAGISSITLFDFTAGTVLGLLPGIAVFAVVGKSLGDAFHNPDAKDLAMLGGGIALWFLLVMASHFLVRKKRAGT